ncbi:MULTISPECIES: hypothetical protein [unclassified Microcoleus]|uniref:hypothetical protein n=1 Tax=unclassified Microcoleus TaxID=2642155 RepID=UPI002FD42709
MSYHNVKKGYTAHYSLSWGERHCTSVNYWLYPDNTVIKHEVSWDDDWENPGTGDYTNTTFDQLHADAREGLLTELNKGEK